eukprot:m.332377 g.332377  ORF g.332377 m.332377 type:complete len:104 (-) comp16941_c0_seq1:61-372(-)
MQPSCSPCPDFCRVPLDLVVEEGAEGEEEVEEEGEELVAGVVVEEEEDLDVGEAEVEGGGEVDLFVDEVEDDENVIQSQNTYVMYRTRYYLSVHDVIFHLAQN